MKQDRRSWRSSNRKANGPWLVCELGYIPTAISRDSFDDLTAIEVEKSGNMQELYFSDVKRGPPMGRGPNIGEKERKGFEMVGERREFFQCTDQGRSIIYSRPLSFPLPIDIVILQLPRCPCGVSSPSIFEFPFDFLFFNGKRIGNTAVLSLSSSKATYSSVTCIILCSHIPSSRIDET